MGDPRKLHKKFKSPGHPWQKERIQSELPYVGKYGLRNKREIWRHRTQLGRFRQIARGLLSAEPEVRKLEESILIKKVSRLGLIPEESNLDDVLDLTLDDIMERRFQTIVLRKGLANTIYQARQLITHGHIAINDKIIKSPSYVVKVDEENNLGIAKGSSIQPAKELDKSKKKVKEEVKK